MRDITRSSGSSPSEAVVGTWLKAIHDRTGVRIAYTKAVHFALSNRAIFVKSKTKKLASSGGRQMRAFLQSEWDFVVPASSIIEQLQKENDQLQVKVKSTETANEKLRKELSTVTNTHVSKRRSTGTDYSERHSRRLKRHRADTCCASLGWLEKEGYVPLKLEALNTKTGDVEAIVLNPERSEEVFGQSEITDNELDTINMLLFVKDKYDVSGRAYHEFATVCKQLPRHYKLKRRISELNTLWSIRPTPNGTCGVQQSLKDRLLLRIKQLHKVAPKDAQFRTQKKIRVKLSGDGTNIGKHLHVINFTFTLLDEGSKAYSSDGNHVLAILREAESYDSLQRGLEDVRNDVEGLTSIEVDGITYDLEYYLGGDWKFLAIVMGIDSAISEYACIWCKCPREERANMDKTWSITDTTHGARTVKENIEISQKPKSKRKYNVSHPPLFPTIPLHNVVIDNLHMFLRVSDALLNLLLVDLKRADGIQVLDWRKF